MTALSLSLIRKLCVDLRFQITYSITYRLDLLSLLVWNRNVELLLQFHDQLYCIQ